MSVQRVAGRLRRRPILLMLCGVAASIAVPSAAQAQNVVTNISYGELTGFATKTGDGELRDRRVDGEAKTASYLELRHQDQNQAKKCFETGCIFFVNETRGYDVIGMYLDTAKKGVGAECAATTTMAG